VVACIELSGEAAGGLRSAVADGGRGCVAGPCSADVAASERVEVRIKKIINTPLRSKKSWFILLAMADLRYRGREIGEEDILSIRALIERYPGESRRKLSTRICEAWQWRQSNGALRDMVCRGMLLMLERAGQITLPPVSYVRHNPLAHRARRKRC